MSSSMSPSSGKKRTRIEETTRASSYDGSALSDLGPPTNAISSGPFRDNIRRFLKDCAEPTKHSSVAGFPTWRSPLVVDNSSLHLSLYIVEEDVRKSDRPLCDTCRCVGWSHHFVSKRRYHLIIPREGEWSNPKMISKAVLDLNTHLLHGMIHCNGFGHLLCIDRNDSCQTEEIMNLWDQICSILGVRKITLQDLEKKGTMDLRLLDALTNGRSWFAKWGYSFHRGSFGVTQDKYERALQVLFSLELDTIIQDNLRDAKEIQHIITVFREAAAVGGAKSCETSSLVTVSDLFQFMVALRSSNTNNKKQQQPPPPREKKTKFKKAVAFSSLLNSRWPERRLEHAVKVIANTLKNHKKAGGESMSSSMSRQQVRDAVRLYIGDTGLIDFVLKNINDVVVGNLIIRRRMKPETKTLEFSVEEKQQQQQQQQQQMLVDSNCNDQEEEEDVDSFPRNKTLRRLEEGGVDDVVKYVYDNVVGFGYSEGDPVRWATKVILNSKHFIKSWEMTKGGKELLDEKCVRLMCRVMPSYEELVKKLTRQLPPGEVVVVPEEVTVEELKGIVQKGLRDTYVVTEKMVVKEVRVVWGDEVIVRGSGLDLKTKLRYEGGLEEWKKVDCLGCGARDDDGERMVECDECGVWQHTLCSTISDDEDVPPIFICGRCNNPPPLNYLSKTNPQLAT